MKLLPDSIKLFLFNRLLEISGVASILLSAFILVSIVSYSSFDPSILNLNNYEVKNIGGYIGANVSEILMQLFGYSSFLICIVLTSWAYKLFFSKSLELFALNFLLLPITVYLLALFFEAVSIPISNGFIATQSLVFINETNLLTSVYLNYLFVTIIFIFFLTSFYFTMGLNLDEWNKFLKVVSQLIKVLVVYVGKTVSLVNANLFKNPVQKISSGSTFNSKGLEPKIDFESLKNEPVSTYDNEVAHDKIVSQQGLTKSFACLVHITAQNNKKEKQQLISISMSHR